MQIPGFQQMFNESTFLDLRLHILAKVSLPKILGIVQEKSGTIQNDLFISFCVIVHLESEKTRNVGTVFIFRSFTFTARFARRELES